MSYSKDCHQKPDKTAILYVTQADTPTLKPRICRLTALGEARFTAGSKGSQKQMCG
jgi:hypothetical protein